MTIASAVVYYFLFGEDFAGRQPSTSESPSITSATASLLVTLHLHCTMKPERTKTAKCVYWRRRLTRISNLGRNQFSAPLMLFPLYSSLQRFWLKFQAWCVMLKSANDPAELVSEHTLCPQCQHSVNTSIALHSEQRSKGSEPFRRYPDIRDLEDSASPLAAGCHLCSLILGRLRENAEQQTSAPITSIDVSIRTSRSGGVTFLIESGTDARNRWRGELVLVPQDDWDEFVTLSRQTDARPGFVFPPAKQHIYQNAQIAKSLASNATFSLAREWLHKCLGQHHGCSEASQMSNCRPSRLIDVGDDNGTDPRLVHTDELPSSQRLEFLTLSHCWGGAAILRLLSDNVARLSTGIPMPDLPKTFQDAVIITRRLG